MKEIQLRTQFHREFLTFYLDLEIMEYLLKLMIIAESNTEIGLTATKGLHITLLKLVQS